MPTIITTGSMAASAFGFARNKIAVATDAFFNYVSLLLNGDGTNGAQNNTFLDSSANNFTITRNGNTTQGSFSPYGTLWSNYFNGSSNLVTTATQIIPSTGDFTVECWVYWTNASYCTIFAQGTNGGAGRVDCYIDYTNGKIALQIDGPAVSSTGTITKNTWNNIAITRTGSSVAFYINGATAGTGTLSNATQNTTFKIGADWATQPFYGNISNLRVSNTIRYSSAFTPSTTPFTSDANTILLACQSNRFIDTSSNAYALTVNGSPQVTRFSPFNPTSAYSTSVIGGAGYFDGSGYLTAGNQTNLHLGSGDFTVDGWIYKNANSAYMTVCGDFATASTNTFQIIGDAGGTKIGWYNGATNSFTITSSATIPLYTWTYIAFVRSGTTLSLYINGVVDSTASLSTNYNASTSLYIGQTPELSSGRYWNGYISDFRIIKGTAITPTVPTAPLTAITNTQLLLSYQNAGIPDLAMQNALQTVGNAQVSTSVYKYGTGSLSFGTSANYLYIPPTQTSQKISSSAPWTVENWLYYSSTPGTTIIWGTCGTSNANGWQFFYDGAGTLYFQQSGSGSNNTTASWSPTTNTWYYMTVTWDGTTIRIFINGTIVATNTVLPTQNFQGWNIGGRSDNYGIGGYIDDFRVTNGVARYTANFTPPTAALPTY
jgi:hypothetical protein